MKRALPRRAVHRGNTREVTAMKRKYRVMAGGLVLLLTGLLVAGVPQKPAQTQKGGQVEKIFTGYTERQLEDRLTAAYGNGDGTVPKKATVLLEQLRAKNPEKAERWDELLQYWQYVNTELELNRGFCPENLPQDGSLCFVVLGYQLNSDGTMKEELLGRLETALLCAEQYPEAVIAVTGGGTALKNRETTEADCMAAYLQEKGVVAERLIVENKSTTTAENALFTCPLLEEKGITQIVLVSSDYHIRWGSVVFGADFILSGSGIRVTGNAAYDAGGKSELSLRMQASEVRSILRGIGN